MAFATVALVAAAAWPRGTMVGLRPTAAAVQRAANVKTGEDAPRHRLSTPRPPSALAVLLEDSDSRAGASVQNCLPASPHEPAAVRHGEAPTILAAVSNSAYTTGTLGGGPITTARRGTPLPLAPSSPHRPPIQLALDYRNVNVGAAQSPSRTPPRPLAQPALDGYNDASQSPPHLPCRSLERPALLNLNRPYSTCSTQPAHDTTLQRDKPASNLSSFSVSPRREGATVPTGYASDSIRYPIPPASTVAPQPTLYSAMLLETDCSPPFQGGPALRPQQPPFSAEALDSKGCTVVNTNRHEKPKEDKGCPPSPHVKLTLDGYYDAAQSPSQFPPHLPVQLATHGYNAPAQLPAHLHPPPPPRPTSDQRYLQPSALRLTLAMEIPRRLELSMNDDGSRLHHTQPPTVTTLLPVALHSTSCRAWTRSLRCDANLFTAPPRGLLGHVRPLAGRPAFGMWRWVSDADLLPVE